MKTVIKTLGLVLAVAYIFMSQLVLAIQNQPATGHIIFNNFTGVYHLSRDSRGLSLLTSEETILADFPANPGFYGITRSIPKKYQNHSVDVKILNVEDAAGNSLAYKTSTSADSLVVTVGDPAIMLYGSQTFKINYQTSGVIDLRQSADQLLLNVNGRGWDQPFSKVNATLYIPASFRANLTSNPSCYTVLNDTSSTDCQLNTQKNSDTTIITAKAGPLAAHQALVLKLTFSSATFTNTHASTKQKLFLLAIGLSVAFISIIILIRLTQSKTKVSN